MTFASFYVDVVCDFLLQDFQDIRIKMWNIYPTP